MCNRAGNAEELGLNGSDNGYDTSSGGNAEPAGYGSPEHLDE